jgi:hypothetical protein
MDLYQFMLFYKDAFDPKYFLFLSGFHDHGYGNAGTTSGHLIPDYVTVISLSAGKSQK